jgi:hypothetical protein
MYSFRYNQQDATLYNILYCCQCSTCFRRGFRPSSGAQTVHTASGICQACLLLPLAWVSWRTVLYCSVLYCIVQYSICQACLLLPLAWVSWRTVLYSPTLAVAASRLDIYQMLCVQFELLMMGGNPAWNMYSFDSNKEYCITLHLVGYIQRNIKIIRQSSPSKLSWRPRGKVEVQFYPFFDLCARWGGWLPPGRSRFTPANDPVPIV